jgi:uncharacterized protein (TIGR02145 family)
MSSCAKEFRNPYDPATPPDIWMPKAFKLDTLGTNALRLSWNQDEQHIDGFAIQKSTNGQLKEILLPLDSLRYTDTQAVDTSSDEVCPELSYKVMARAGNNRSLDIGTTSGIRMPLSTPANSGTDILVTDTSTTVQLNAQAANPGERGQWTIISGTGGSYSNQNAHNSTFTGSPCTDYVLRWTKSGCTETYDEVSVKFQKAITIANAGTNQNITSNETQVTLNANNPGAGDSGIWTIISGSGGTLENPSMPNTLFTGQSCTNYVLRWTITDVCNSSVDEMNVNFQKATTTANAGANQNITNNSTQVTLSANAPTTGETGTWTIISGVGGNFSNANSSTSTFTGNACSSYTLRWTMQGLCSSNIDDVVISFSQSNTIANAGPDQTITSNPTQVTLAANTPSADEIGTWSIVSGVGGSFSCYSCPTSIFTGVSDPIYVLRWSILGNCNYTMDQVTINYPSVTDIDGNIYRSQIIGTQEWMGENLKTSRYCNGDLIPNITDSTQWSGHTTGAWCNLNNDNSLDSIFGKLYNWYTVLDSRNVCPCGWHVPSDAEWTILIDYLGGFQVAGGKMKTADFQYWLPYNFDATNESGFSGLPGSSRNEDGLFSPTGEFGFWWSSSEFNTSFARYIFLMSYSGNSNQPYGYKKKGFSVRCLKD